MIQVYTVHIAVLYIDTGILTAVLYIGTGIHTADLYIDTGIHADVLRIYIYIKRNNFYIIDSNFIPLLRVSW